MTEQDRPIQIVIHGDEVFLPGCTGDGTPVALVFTRQQWREFLQGAKDGEFELPEGES
jgi:hypothetical protein